MTPTGTPSFTGLSISVLGIDVTALIEASAGVMVNVSSLTGLSIGIDLVTTSGDGITTRGVVTENIAVHFNNVSTLGGVINGDLVIGQSQASMLTASSVPEPSSMALMGSGAVFLFGAALRQRARKRIRSAA